MGGSRMNGLRNIWLAVMVAAVTSGAAFGQTIFFTSPSSNSRHADNLTAQAFVSGVTTKGTAYFGFAETQTYQTSKLCRLFSRLDDILGFLWLLLSEFGLPLFFQNCFDGLVLKHLFC